jgi:hypothetical protein
VNMRRSSRYIVTFCKATTAVAALVSILSAASLTHVEDISWAIFLPAVQVPKWTHGGLLTVQFKDTKSPLIWMLSPSGDKSLPFSVPGAESTLIYDCDRASDGTIGISGSAADSDGRVAGFVAWISPNEPNGHVVRTGSYRPAMVAIAPDGTLWTVGKQTTAAATAPAEIVPHAGAIQHFDRSGKTLGSFVPQSTIRNPLLTLSRTRNTLRASKDRIAWYSVDGRYVEMSVSGSLVTDIVVDIPPGRGKPLMDNISFALTDEGDAFLSVPYEVPSTGAPLSPIDVFETYVLDRSARAWRPVQLAGQSPRSGVGYIYGVDGKRLVVMGGRAVRFYAIGK